MLHAEHSLEKGCGELRIADEVDILDVVAMPLGDVDEDIDLLIVLRIASDGV